MGADPRLQVWPAARVRVLDGPSGRRTEGGRKLARGVLKPVDMPTPTHHRMAAEILEHLEALTARATQLTRCPSERDDLIQDTVERGLRHAAELEDHANLRAWLLRTMFNLFVDHTRRRRKLVPLAEDAAARMASPAPYQPTAWEMLTEADVRIAVARLSQEHQEALLLTVFENRTYQHVAQALDVPLATIGSRVFRARRQVRQLLENPDLRLPKARRRLRRSSEGFLGAMSAARESDASLAVAV